MKEKIKQILKKLYLYQIVLFFLHYYYLIGLLFKLHKKYKKNIRFYNSFIHKFNHKQKSVLFLINNPFMSLYFYPLMFNFDKLGYNIILKYNYRLISLLNYGARHIFELKNLNIKKLNNIKNQRYGLVFYDIKNEKIAEKIICDKKVYFHKYKDSCNKENLNLSVAPYIFHPDIYYNNLYKNIPNLRNTKRKIKIFFSGNINEYVYTKFNVKKTYNIINRFDIIQSIKEKLNDEELLEIRKQDDLNKILAKGNSVNKFVGIFTDWNPNQKRNIVVKIPIEKWLQTLSYSDFFLACPGIQIPFSHNVVEAMSVGTIPVLQYGNLFEPPLEHMLNCIEFNSLEDLIEKFHIIFLMKKDEISKIKKNVLNYYDNHLDNDKFVNEIINNFPKKSTLVLYTEYFKLWEH